MFLMTQQHYSRLDSLGSLICSIVPNGCRSIIQHVAFKMQENYKSNFISFTALTVILHSCKLKTKCYKDRERDREKNQDTINNNYVRFLFSKVKLQFHLLSNALMLKLSWRIERRLLHPQKKDGTYRRNFQIIAVFSATTAYFQDIYHPLSLQKYTKDK